MELPIIDFSSNSCHGDHAGEAASGGRGKNAPWRSLDEYADTAEFREMLHREFPKQASEWNDGVGRRRFLQLMGASLALGGMAGCNSKPAEKILPYVRAPEDILAGRPLTFATTMPFGDDALGVLAVSHEGRPTKIEGNELHPASLGATNSFAQASILDLYDPDRSQTVMHLAQISTWEAFLAALRKRLDIARPREGAGVCVLMTPTSSPTALKQLRAFQQRFPQAKVFQYDAAGGDGSREATRAAFGEALRPVYRFDRAKVVVSLGSDFLSGGPASVRYARDLMSRRKVRGENREMSRIYVVETAPTVTGAAADHRVPMTTRQIESFVRALAARLGVSAAGSTQTGDGPNAPLLEAMIEDLNANRGASLVVAGTQLSLAVQALAFAINGALGNAGATVEYLRFPEAETVTAGTITELAAELEAGRVETLLILDGNPAYTAPAELSFSEKMEKAKWAAHLASHVDETSAYCHWHIPVAHFLESWSDARTYDGTASIVQPLIKPMYAGRTVHEVLSAVVDEAVGSPRELVRATWREAWGEADFERKWAQSLHDGVIADSALAAVTPTLNLAAAAISTTAVEVAGDAIEVNFRPDSSVWDGRFANNGWLQEAPRPFSKLTWDNAVYFSIKTAKDRGLKEGDIVVLSVEGRKIAGPVLIAPGHADNAATVHLGYGREAGGNTARDVGFDAYPLRTSSSFWTTSAKLERAAGKHQFATTQQHFNIQGADPIKGDDLEGRDIIRRTTLAEYAKDPHAAEPVGHGHGGHEPLSLIPDHPSTGYAWGMSIDMTSCIGCNGCVVACQAENNIPVVGKEQVSLGREMHWLRIDTYYFGEPTSPEVVQQPMLCQHCEKAPCEVVCPVAATSHSAEGLNEMTYNRCVGTRYCSNNCPYKVRRFNFLQYTDETTPVLMLMRNPDVTVRSRGVMEKCSYCVQRINRARIDAKIHAVRSEEGGRIADGEVVTACQAACPTQAIVFGDLSDPNSRVTKLKAEALDYSVIGELGTRPRTTYLAQLRNPHPRLG